MSEVDSNSVCLSFTEENADGSLPGSPEWIQTEYLAIASYGAEYNKAANESMTKRRSRRKGKTVGITAPVEFSGYASNARYVRRLLEGFLYSTWVGPDATIPTDVNALTDDFVHPTLPGGALAQNTLVYARGFSEDANNGLHVVGPGSTATSTVTTSSLVDEPSPPPNAELVQVGVLGATGDIQVDANGNLTSTALDFTALPLFVGGAIYLPNGDKGAGVFGFANTANSGFARIKSISANLLELDSREQAFATDTGAGKQIRIFFGQWLRDVAVTDALFKRRKFRFEMLMPELGGAGIDKYYYAEGEAPNDLTMTLGTEGQVSMDYTFVGRDADEPTLTRLTNAENALTPVASESYSTADEIGRLRISKLDETGLLSCFTDATLTIANGVEPRPAIGSLGAKFTSIGKMLPDLTLTAFFTDSSPIGSIRSDETVHLDMWMRNSEGAMLWDFPSQTLGDGSLNIAANELVTIDLSGEVYGEGDSHQVAVTWFPHISDD